MNCAQIEQLLASYLDGAVSADEKTAIEAHLKDCADCREALLDLQAIQKGFRQTLKDAVATERPAANALAVIKKSFPKEADLAV